MLVPGPESKPELELGKHLGLWARRKVGCEARPDLEVLKGHGKKFMFLV